MKNRRIFVSCVVIIMCLSMLTGCDFLPPKTAADLVQRSAKAMSTLDNYRMSMDMNIDANIVGNIEGVDMDMTVPIEFTFKIDRAGNYIAGDMDVNADINATVSFMGQTETMSESINKSAEMYMVIDGNDVITYMNDDNTGWVCSEDGDRDAFDMYGLLDVDAENNIFANAAMEKTDAAYVVTLKFADALENEAFVDFMAGNMSSDIMGETDIDWDDFADVIGDSNIIYTFDAKTYHLLSIETDVIKIDDVDFIASMDDMDMNEMDVDSMGINMDIAIEFSKFDKIDVDDVKVPDDIKDEAVDEAGANIIIDIEPTDSVELPVATDDDIESTESVALPIVTDDVRFVYNGVKLDVPTDYQIFLNDGWYPVDDGDYGSFLCMMNDKYGYMTLYLYTNDGSGTEAYVKEHGADGFSMTVDESGKVPELSLCGVTFGDDLSAVKSVLGEPDSMQEYSDSYGTYGTYEWDIEYDDIDCMLTVSLWNGSVSEMSISYWG